MTCALLLTASRLAAGLKRAGVLPANRTEHAGAPAQTVRSPGDFNQN
ncbi:MAG TPA: hypothetical protein VK327_08665 [Candidatus Paceibacterota bacterium]|nr:hypothetical protein [Candidatus Paceibacterota bacterium]